MSSPVSSSPPESWLELPNGNTFPLAMRCAIGRQPDNDVAIDVVELSRHHALVSFDNGAYVLSDLHSRNGTHHNGTLVKRPVPLRDGDEILLGTVKLRFRRKRSWFGTEKTPSDLTSTVAMDSIRERFCWLLLVDVLNPTALTTKLGNEAALRQKKAWINGLRPLIEKNAGQISGYFGDAITAYWPGDNTKPALVVAALKAIEAWRVGNALPFRLVAHYGPVLFSRSDFGQEITGSAMNVLQRSEKIAKGFGTTGMISQSVVDTLGLTDQCESYGRSSIDGMSDYFIFYALPEAWTPKK